MSPDTITENVHAINSLCENPRCAHSSTPSLFLARPTSLADPRRPARRQKFVFEKLVSHLHNFARDVSLTTDEWMCVSLSLLHLDERAPH